MDAGNTISTITILSPFSGDLQVDENLLMRPISKDVKDNIFKTIHKKLPVARHFEELSPYPSPYTLAKFSSLSYEDFTNINSISEKRRHTFHTQLGTLEGWQILGTAINENLTNGYYGIAFWHPEQQQIVIAHRGTDWKNYGAWYTDAKGVVWGNYVGQISSAATFANEMKLVITELNNEPGIHIRLTLTGHSLGGWLAQITTFTTQFLSAEGSTFRRNIMANEIVKAHTVVFESPGCKDNMLSPMKDKFDVRYQSRMISLKYLDITSYLSAPNRVNSCNKHVGTLYRIIIDYSDMPFYERKTPYYTIATHNLNKIIQALNYSSEQLSGTAEITNLVTMVDWPISKGILGGAEYNKSFEWIKHSNNYHVNFDQNDVTDGKICAFCPIRYQSKSYSVNKCSINVFTTIEQDFLVKYHWLRELPEYFKYNELFASINSQDSQKSAQNYLQHFRIKGDIIRSDIVPLQKFTAFVKHLLHFFPGIMDGIQSAFSTAALKRLVYKYESNHYLEKVAKFKLQFKDSLGIKKFLDDPNQKIFHAIYDNVTQFHLAGVFTIFENVKDSTKFEKSDNYTVLKLKRLLAINSHSVKLNNFLFSEGLQSHLLIINCKPSRSDTDYCTDAKVLLRQLLMIIDTDRIEIKIIFLSEQNDELTLFLKEAINGRSPFNYVTIEYKHPDWDHLSSDSQNAIFKKKIILFPGNSTLLSLSDIMGTVSISTHISEMISKFIDSETIKRYIQNDTIQIGHSFGYMFDMDAAYDKLYEEIEENIFSSIMSKEIDDTTIIFISGASIHGPIDSIFSFLIERFKIARDNSGHLYRKLQSQKIIVDTTEYCTGVNRQTATPFLAFRNLCHQEKNKIVHWVDISENRLRWQQCYRPKFYCKRSFICHNRIMIRNDFLLYLLKGDSPDLCIFSGISDHDFILMINKIGGNVNVVSIPENIKIITKDVDAQIKFRYLGTLTNPVHWVKVEIVLGAKNLIWRCSSGAFDVIRRYTLLKISTGYPVRFDLISCFACSDHKNCQEIVPEQKFPDIMKSSYNRVTIIADEPGMGKSTTLFSLAIQLQPNWVILISSAVFEQTLNSFDFDFQSIEGVVDFLCAVDYKGIGQKLGRVLLQYLLERESPTKLFLLFDGFDEIKNEFQSVSVVNRKSKSPQQEFLQLLSFLQKKTTSYICVTTRLSHKAKLENCLCTFSTYLERFTETEQIEFLKSFWQARFYFKLENFGQEEITKCYKYAIKLLKQGNSMLGPSISSFIGVPLQLKMLAEVSMPKLSFFNEPINIIEFEINDVVDLYDRFIHAKYNIYFKEKIRLYEETEIFRGWVTEKLTRKYRSLSLEALFPKDLKKCLENEIIKNALSVEFVGEDELAELSRAGIIQMIEFQASFIHNTFAEYFSADFLAHWLTIQTNSFNFIDLETLLLEQILIKSEYKVIRLFLNSILLKTGAPDRKKETDVKSEVIEKPRTVIREFRFNENHQTAFHIIAEENLPLILELVITRVCRSHFDLLTLLSERDNQNETALYIAVKLNHTEVINLLLTIIQFSLFHEKERFLLSTMFTNSEARKDMVIQNLIQDYLHVDKDMVGIATTIQANWPLIDKLIQFSIQGNLDNIKELMNHLNTNNNVNTKYYLMSSVSDQKTALHFAAMHGHTNVVAYLLQEGADINIKDKNSECRPNLTPLHYASQLNHKEVVLCLLENHAKIDEPDRGGMTSLMHAAKCGHVQIVDLLIKHSADYSLRDKNGMTAFMWAAKSGSIPVVAFLANLYNNLQIDFNESDKNGMTASAHATKSAKWEVVKFLMELGADFEAPDIYGVSPLVRIIKAGKKDMALYMVEKGATVDCLTVSQKLDLLRYVTKSDIKYNPHNLTQTRNAIYFALRLNNVQLFQTLMDDLVESCGNINNQDDIGVILGQVYEEVGLKNIALSPSIQIFVEKFLIDLHFFTPKNEENSKAVVHTRDDINKRIDMVINQIWTLNERYNGNKNNSIDSVSLLTARYIVQNVHVLKRKLRCTYNKLPWEEMEFCIITFISAQTKFQEMNAVYKTTLPFQKIIKYLTGFAETLNVVKSFVEPLDVMSQFPKQGEVKFNRKLAFDSVVHGNSTFIELYKDYEKIKNIYSLHRIESYLKGVMSVNLETNLEIGKLVIERALQVIGESLKNTLESPNLSDDVHNVLIISAPKNLKIILSDLRDSLSHSHTLGNKIKIESEKNPEFFRQIQNDLRKVQVQIGIILYRKKVDALQKLLNTIIKSNDLTEIKRLCNNFKNSEISGIDVVNQNPAEINTIKSLIKQLSEAIGEKTQEESLIFQQIEVIISTEALKLNDLRMKYKYSVFMMNNIFTALNDYDIDSVKKFAHIYSSYMTSKDDDAKLEHIVQLVSKIVKSVHTRSQGLRDSEYNKIKLLFYDIVTTIDFDAGRLKWISTFKDILEGDESVTTDGQMDTFKMVNDVLTEIHNSLVSEKDKQLFSRVVRAKKLMYEARVELNKMLHELNTGLSDTNEEHKIIYEKACTDLELRKNIQTKLNQAFHDSDWEKCIRIVNNVRDSYTSLLDGVTNTMRGSKSSDISDYFEQFIRSGIKNKNLMQELITVVRLVLPSNKDNSNEFAKRMTFLKKQVQDDLDFKKLLQKYKENDNFRISSEMVLLEITEILDKHNLFTDNRLFLDKHYSALTGKCFRNYLAHGDPLVDVLLLNPSVAFASNVVNLVKASDDLFSPNNNKLVGQKILDNPIDLKIRFENSFNMLMNQSEMFLAVQEGNVIKMKDCIAKGADINARDISGCNAFHFAARNWNLETFKFLVSQNLSINATDNFNRTPLQFAVRFDNVDIFKYLIKQNMLLLDKTNERKETLLHFCVRENKTKLLHLFLENNANVNFANVDGVTPLHLAASYNRIDIFNLLLQYGADVNTHDKYNWTPLHSAAERGHVNLTAILLNKGANIDTVGYEDITPLHYAAQNGQTETMSLLIHEGANVNLRSKQNYTPLHMATIWTNLDALLLLLDNKGDPNAKNYLNLSPLHYAIKNSDFEATKSILAHGGDVNILGEKKMTPLHYAAFCANKRIGQLIIEHGACVNQLRADNMSAIHLAAENNNPEFITTLLQNQANVNEAGRGKWTPLHVAAHKGHIETVILLLDNHAIVSCVDQENWTPLHFAAQNNHATVAKILINKGASTSVQGFNGMYPIHLASQYDFCVDVIQILLECGARVSVRDIDNTTPLHLAAQNGCMQVVDVLLKSGADINAVDNDNVTPLHLAAMQGQKDVVNELLQKKAAIEAADVYCGTPLYYAAQNGYKDVALTLINAGANVNSVDELKATPLHMASLNGYNEIAILLIEKGAIVDALDCDGKTPLYLAVWSSHNDIVSTLLKHDANVNIMGREGETPLLYASQKGNEEIVLALLNKGAIPNVSGREGRSALHLAAANGHTGVVKLLLNKGSKVDTVDKDNATPLHYAVKLGYKDIIRQLLDKSVNCCIPDNNGYTVLHWAAQLGDEEAVQSLLGNNADANLKTNKGLRAIDIALLNGKMHVVDILSNAAEISNE